MTTDAISRFIERLVLNNVVRPYHAIEIVQRRFESSHELWASPFLRDVREHTRAEIDALCARSASPTFVPPSANEEHPMPKYSTEIDCIHWLPIAEPEGEPA